MRRHLVVGLLILAGCGQPDTPDDPVALPSTHRVGVDDAQWGELTWLDEDRLVVSYLRGSGPERLAIVTLEGEFAPMNVPADPACRGTSYGFPRAYGGRLLAIEMCYRVEPDLFATYNLVEVDPTERTVRPLMSAPSEERLFAMSLDPDGSRAAVMVGSSICSTLGIASSGGVDLLSLEIRDGDRSWNLRDGYPLEDTAETCSQVGLAAWPAWSTDGFAFFASPQSIGIDGAARADVPSNLYLMDDPAGSTYSIILSDIGDPRALEWSPDGDWLAFTGDVPSMGPGVWLIDASSQRLVQVSTHLAEFLSWSPDGTQLAIVKATSSSGIGKAEIRIADAKQILQSS